MAPSSSPPESGRFGAKGKNIESRPGEPVLSTNESRWRCSWLPDYRYFRLRPSQCTARLLALRIPVRPTSDPRHLVPARLSCIHASAAGHHLLARAHQIAISQWIRRRCSTGRLSPSRARRDYPNRAVPAPSRRCAGLNSIVTRPCQLVLRLSPAPLQSDRVPGDLARGNPRRGGLELRSRSRACAGDLSLRRPAAQGFLHDFAGLLMFSSRCLHLRRRQLAAPLLSNVIKAS